MCTLKRGPQPTLAVQSSPPPYTSILSSRVYRIYYHLTANSIPFPPTRPQTIQPTSS